MIRRVGQSHAIFGRSCRFESDEVRWISGTDRSKDGDVQRLTFDHLPQPAHGPELAVVWPAGDVTSVRKGVQSWFPSIASFAAQ